MTKYEITEEDEKLCEEADKLFDNVNEQYLYGDIDDLLVACRNLIKFHIKDINKFFSEDANV